MSVNRCDLVDATTRDRIGRRVREAPTKDKGAFVKQSYSISTSSNNTYIRTNEDSSESNEKASRR